MYRIGKKYSWQLLMVTMLSATVYAQPQKLAGIIPSDGTAIGVARKDQKVFGDHNYHFTSLPAIVDQLHCLAGSYEKGVRIELLAEGNLYAASPAKGNLNAQEDVLLADGFNAIDQAPFRLFKEDAVPVQLYVKKVQSAELNTRVYAYNRWVILFFSGHSLPSCTIPAVLLSTVDTSFAKNSRLWQGCPSIEKTGKRFWATWFSGGRWEPDKGNYGIICYSDKGVSNWVDPALILKHPHEKVRVMDTQLWTDPSGNLWLFWVQNSGNHAFDGIWGTWASVCSNPSAAKPKWSAPRRLCDGLTRNKPTVLSSGEWLLPSYNWILKESNVYISKDKGKSWMLQGGPVNNDVTFYEHMLVERKDKSIWMLQRSIKESSSADKGKTWTNLTEIKELPSASSRLFLSRLRSGNLLLVYNHDPGRKDRKNMTALISDDDGKSWPYKLLLDERSGTSYPDAVQDKDGMIYLVYDRSRQGEKEILMAVFTEEEIKAGTLSNKKSILKYIVSKPVSAAPVP